MQKQNPVLGGNNPTPLDALAVLPKRVLGLLVDKSSANHHCDKASLARVQPAWQGRGSLPFFCTFGAPSAVLGHFGSQCKSSEPSRGHQDAQGWRRGHTRRGWASWVCSAQRSWDLITFCDGLMGGCWEGSSQKYRVEGWESTSWSKGNSR